MFIYEENAGITVNGNNGILDCIGDEIRWEFHQISFTSLWK